jgi:sulfur-oxidizing protein SoxY
MMSLSLTFSSSVFAEADSKLWPVLKEAFFEKREIKEVDFIKIDAPTRAESGAQVPITYKIDNFLSNGVVIKKLYVFVDANPIPLTSTYHFTDALSDTKKQAQFELSTRIRFETDSYVHLVGESEAGQLFFTSREIRASGGCGSTDNGDEAAIRAAVGNIKLKVGELDEPVKLGSPAYVTFNIKHIMRTGLQRDAATQGYYPAFYIKKTTFTYNSKPLFSVDIGVGTAEDPYIKFNFVPDAMGTLAVTAADNEGKIFVSEVEVKGAE